MFLDLTASHFWVHVQPSTYKFDQFESISSIHFKYFQVFPKDLRLPKHRSTGRSGCMAAPRAQHIVRLTGQGFLVDLPWGWQRWWLSKLSNSRCFWCMFLVDIYMYIYSYIHICIYIYVYIQVLRICLLVYVQFFGWLNPSLRMVHPDF